MKQTVQNPPNRQEQRRRQQDKTDKRADNGQPLELQKEKVSLSQLVTAAEMFADGRTGKHTAAAASHFGNQTMLGLLEDGQALKNGIASVAEVLSGEAPPDFSADISDNMPSAEMEAESAFAPSAPPEFSTGAPTTDIQTVGTAGLI